MPRAGIYAVSHDGTLISGCQSNEYDTGENEIVQGADGLVDPKFVALMSADPMVKFSTVDIASALDVAAFSGGVFSTNLIMFLQLWADGGTRAGTLSHVKLSCTDGIMVPTKISAKQDGVATIDYDCYCKSSDGLTHPWTIAGSQTLAGTPDLAAAFTVGEVDINGTTLNDVQSIDINFGINIEVARGDGDVYPTAFYIKDRRPSITITTKDPNVIGTYEQGVAQGATDSIVYLRKIAEDGARVADATQEHISFTIDAGRISMPSAGGDEGASSDLTLQITPTYDGTNDIVALDTTAAIA